MNPPPTAFGRPLKGAEPRTRKVRWTFRAWRRAGPLARRGLQGPPADRRSRIRGVRWDEPHGLRSWSHLAVIAAALLAGGAHAEPVPYGLDPTHTFVYLEVLHMGTSTSRARFDRLAGNVSFDARGKAIDISITVDTDSINAGAEPFNKVMRGASLLASAEHPKAWFVATRATFEGEVPRLVHGEITLRGVSQPLTLRAVRWRCALNPLFQREVCGGDFEATVKRSDFGMTLALPLVADEVKVLVQVEGVRGGLPQ